MKISCHETFLYHRLYLDRSKGGFYDLSVDIAMHAFLLTFGLCNIVPRFARIKKWYFLTLVHIFSRFQLLILYKWPKLIKTWWYWTSLSDTYINLLFTLSSEKDTLVVDIILGRDSTGWWNNSFTAISTTGLPSSGSGAIPFIVEICKFAVIFEFSLLSVTSKFSSKSRFSRFSRFSSVSISSINSYSQGSEQMKQYYEQKKKILSIVRENLSTSYYI